MNKKKKKKASMTFCKNKNYIRDRSKNNIVLTSSKFNDRKKNSKTFSSGKYIKKVNKHKIINNKNKEKKFLTKNYFKKSNINYCNPRSSLFFGLTSRPRTLAKKIKHRKIKLKQSKLSNISNSTNKSVFQISTYTNFENLQNNVNKTNLDKDFKMNKHFYKIKLPLYSKTGYFSNESRKSENFFESLTNQDINLNGRNNKQKKIDCYKNSKSKIKDLITSDSHIKSLSTINAFYETSIQNIKEDGFSDKHIYHFHNYHHHFHHYHHHRCIDSRHICERALEENLEMKSWCDLTFLNSVISSNLYKTLNKKVEHFSWRQKNDLEILLNRNKKETFSNNKNTRSTNKNNNEFTIVTNKTSLMQPTIKKLTKNRTDSILFNFCRMYSLKENENCPNYSIKNRTKKSNLQDSTYNSRSKKNDKYSSNLEKTSTFLCNSVVISNYNKYMNTNPFYMSSLDYTIYYGNFFLYILMNIETKNCVLKKMFGLRKTNGFNFFI
jgi:hypothetical protein